MNINELHRLREYDYLLDCYDILDWKRCEQKDACSICRPLYELRYADGHTVLEYIVGKITDDDVIKLDALIDYCKKQENTQARMYSVHEFDEKPAVKTSVYTNDYGVFSRPTLEYVFMSMAQSLANRSTCLRKKVGVVFTDPLMQQAYCLGYNGDEIGGKNQCESLKPGECNCVHAEINALTKNNFDITGCTCFITLAPCPVCAKVLINRRVKKVIYLESYRKSKGIDLLRERGIQVIKYEDLP